MTPIEHLAEDCLEGYSLNRLSAEQVEIAEEHLLGCKFCQTRQQKMDDFVAASKTAAARIADEPQKKSPNAYVAIAIAAAVAAIFFIPRSLEPAATIELSAVRNEAKLSVPAGKPLKIKLDLTGLVGTDYSWEIVGTNLSGKVNSNEPVLTVSGLSQGQYWVRLRAESGSELVREFSLAVR